MILLSEILMMEELSPSLKASIASSAVLVNRTIMSSDALKQAKVPAFKTVFEQIKNIQKLPSLSFKDEKEFQANAKFYYFYIKFLLRFSEAETAFQQIQEKLENVLSQKKNDAPATNPAEPETPPTQQQQGTSGTVEALIGTESVALKTLLIKSLNGTSPASSNLERTLKGLAQKINVDSTYSPISDSVYKPIVDQIFRLDQNMFKDLTNKFFVFTGPIGAIQKQIINLKPEELKTLLGFNPPAAPSAP